MTKLAPLYPLLRLIAIFGGGVVSSGLLAWLIYLLQDEPAPLANIAYALCGIIAGVITCIALVKVSFRAGPVQVEVDAD